jgi:hypothetical protein
MSQLLYLYGFVPATAPEPPPPPALDGVAGSAVHLHDGPGIRAAVSRVPGEEYAADRIEARMDDLEWVAAQGLAHERVVSWFVDHGDIVPVPLFTLYSGVAALDADMRERGGTVTSMLQRLAGLREWDVKLAYEPNRLQQRIGAAAPAVAALDDEIAAAAPGRRFLLERKRGDLVRSEVRRVAAERADSLFDALAAHARDAVRLEIPATSGAVPVLLHAALLVGREQEAGVHGALAAEGDALAALGFHASLTGPWAPYRFLDTAGRTDAGSPAQP